MDWKWFITAISGILAGLSSVFVWFKSQKQQRAQDEYTHKEKLYRELLVRLPGTPLKVATLGNS